MREVPGRCHSVEALKRAPAIRGEEVMRGQGVRASGALQRCAETVCRWEWSGPGPLQRAGVLRAAQLDPQGRWVGACGWVGAACGREGRWEGPEAQYRQAVRIVLRTSGRYLYDMMAMSRLVSSSAASTRYMVNRTMAYTLYGISDGLTRDATTYVCVRLWRCGRDSGTWTDICSRTWPQGFVYQAGAHL